MLVSSVPLSETHMAGRPRTAMSASSSRVTRSPGRDVSAMGVQAFPREVVANHEDAEAPAIAKCIRYEIHAPALIGSLRDRYRCSCSQRTLAAGTPAHLQPLLTVES
jgi:hypothetical protein